MGDLELFQRHKSGPCFVGGCSPVPQVIFLLWSARLSKNVTFSISQMMFLFRVWEEARLKNYRFCGSRWRGKKQRDKESQQQPLASTLHRLDSL